MFTIYPTSMVNGVLENRNPIYQNNVEWKQPQLYNLVKSVCLKKEIKLYGKFIVVRDNG